MDRATDPRITDAHGMKKRRRRRVASKPLAAGLSIAAFAGELDVDEKAIRKGIASGRLTSRSVARKKSGRGYVITDRAAALEEWTANARQVATSSSSSPAPRDTLIEASRIATLERGRRLRNENDLREGRLVEIGIAKREAFESARIIRETLLNLPIRLAAALAGETDPDRVFQVLDAAIREALGVAADRLEAAGE
jgi:hypothetical protein